MKAMKSSMVPAVAVGLGLAGAGLWYGLADVGAEAPNAENAPKAEQVRSPDLPTGAPQGQPGIEGRVLEVIDVPKYTYLRIAADSGAEHWVAVATSPIEVGQVVAIRDATEMRNFASSTLNRTFASIWFGSLATPGVRTVSPHGMPLPQGSPGSPHGASTGGPGAAMGGLPAHHAAPVKGGDDVAVGQVPRATSPHGRRVAEIHAQKQELAGKAASVRGVVVKSMGGILGKTFVHLRDGSGDAAAGTHDLTVTTGAEPKVGEQVTLEGTVTVNKDYGSGYTYPVVLEDARLVAE